MAAAVTISILLRSSTGRSATRFSGGVSRCLINGSCCYSVIFCLTHNKCSINISIITIKLNIALWKWPGISHLVELKACAKVKVLASVASGWFCRPSVMLVDLLSPVSSSFCENQPSLLRSPHSGCHSRKSYPLFSRLAMSRIVKPHFPMSPAGADD